MEEALHAHLRPPILKILHSHGITKASSISLQVLSSLCDKYLKALVASCQEYANHAGRNSLQVYDVLQSLEEMGTMLDDLRDHLEVDGGVQYMGGADRPAGANPTGLQRYANVISARKEAELSDFKESLRSGLPTSDDNPPQRLRYSRLDTPDSEDYDVPDTPSSDAGSVSRQDDSMAVDKPAPVSNGELDYRDGDSYLLPFLPPFPAMTQQDTEDGLNDTEKEEQLRREEELQKQKEAERKEKEAAEDGAVVQSIPANYIVPAPYEMSKLQARGTWHLPALSHSAIDNMQDAASRAAGGTSSAPFVRGSSTTEELLSALHALTPSTSTENMPPTPSTSSFHSVSTNPSRHKVSLVFLGTTPARFNTPDTLFGLGASLSVTPRPSNSLPTYVHALPEQPGIRDAKVANKNKATAGELPLPPSQGRSVGVPATIINAVSGSSSRIPVVGRALLSKPTFTRTKRLGPPPAQKRDEKLLLYHPPNPPLPAHWNTAVSGSNAAANIGHDHTKGRQERNAFGVAEATLGYTWDWNVKLPREGLEKVKTSTAVLASMSHGPGETALSTPIQANGSSDHIAKERLPPKLSVSVPGRKQSMLSTSTPISGTPLVTRIPTVGERTNSSSGLAGSMLPPPVPVSVPTGSSEPPRKPTLSIRLVHNRSSSQPSAKNVDESERTRHASPDVHPASTVKAEGDEGKAVLHESPMDTDLDSMLASTIPPDEKPLRSNPPRSDSGGDMDIDAALAEVIGEDIGGMAKVEVGGEDDDDADLEDVFGPDLVADFAPATVNPLHDPKPEEDVDLDDLLLSGVPKDPMPQDDEDHLFDLSVSAVGDPLPPGDGSSYMFTEMDRIPATAAGTMSFSSSTTLPLATSALRTTTTPLVPTSQPHHSNGIVPHPTPEALERGYFAEHLDHQKNDSSTKLVTVQKESSTTPLVAPQGHY